jgi:hypothetical protein
VLDYLKHITTLDTGSIVLLTALLDKFFAGGRWKFLVVVTFLGFLGPDQKLLGHFRLEDVVPFAMEL